MNPLRLAFVVFVAILAGVSVARADESGSAASSRNVRGIVELFTSQGCADCPKADAVLARLAARPDYVALAYHVDYWDYIGWEDPLGSRRNAERQKAYSKSLRLGGLTTPQAIVNGHTATSGADERAIETTVAEAPLPGAGNGPLIEMRLDGDMLRLRAEARPPQPQGRPAALILATYSKETQTAVQRGDNQGRRLLNTHAVREWRAVGVVDANGQLDVTMPLGLLADPDGQAIGCVALLQAMGEDDRPGRILAAAALRF